jgi:parallel beta-helix repeat protein
MPRFLGLTLLTALIAAATLALGGGQALASHVACGDVITQDTTLDSDLIDCPGRGIVIGAGGITLDLDGHTIDGLGGGFPEDHCSVGVASGPLSLCPGPADQSYADVTIKDGTIRDFDFGVLASAADRSAMQGLDVSGAVQAIVLNESRHALISRNRLSGNHIGIGFWSVFQSRVTRNVMFDNQASGIETDGVDETRFDHNIAYGNGSGGMHLHSAHGNVLTHNRAFRNRGSGIETSDGASGNRIVANWAWENGDGVVVFDGAHGNDIERNLLFHNLSAGVVAGGEANVAGNSLWGNGTGVNLDYENGSRVIGNRIFANTVGVLVENSLNQVRQNLIMRSRDTGISVPPVRFQHGVNRIEANHVTRSGGHGIDVGRVDTALGRNRADRNGGLGIKAVLGVSDLGGNWAFGNGDPLQCLNIVCNRRQRR